MTDVATFLKMDAIQLRELNMYREGDRTHFNQIMEHCTLDRCWRECINMSDFQERRIQVESFNKENRWKKRGLALIPTKFGIAFTALFLNQAGALVHIYKVSTFSVLRGTKFEFNYFKNQGWIRSGDSRRYRNGPGTAH